ncbi:MAG: DUF4959 domain-containing protein [Prevotellaceae bacterium]|nr:DUF4959 domain-containing protein [Prevotellaceae bacterium]
MRTERYLTLIIAALFACVSYSCEEGDRYSVSGNDKTPPGIPTIDSIVPIYGGGRVFFTPPKDEDLLSVNAEYTNANGKTFYFTASYFSDSLDVIGFGDTLLHKVKIYAMDRAGNHSEEKLHEIRPLEPTISRVKKSLKVMPGFSSLLVDWENELERSVNVYVYFKYTQQGVVRDLVSVFSSNKLTERRYINNLIPDGTIDVKLQIEDTYGNSTGIIETGEPLTLKEDMKLPKKDWRFPNANDSIAGVPMMFGDNLEGRVAKICDDIIDRGDNLNFLHTGGRGRTGLSGIANQNMPWNLIIDLGGYYRLSRIITVQRHSGGLENISRGQYYKYENVGYYALHILNEQTNQWDSITAHKIPVPVNISELEYVKLGEAGDMAYFYPDNPQYTPPTRWVRYEALNCFDDNYSSTSANCLSEVTLYGIKAN